LALSILPCGDTYDCNQSQYIGISTNANHDNHKHETETCSPFCFCSCCGTTVLNMNDLAIFSDIVAIYARSFPVFKQTFLSVEYFHIWQPPKIS
jgi:hypothetical protein